MRFAFGLYVSLVTISPALAVGTLIFSTAQPTFAEPASPEGRMEDALLFMGYEDIQVESCKLAFARKLENLCPSDLALSYVRTVDLSIVKAENISAISSYIHEGERNYEFHITPTDEYLRAMSQYNIVEAQIRMAFPNSGWPYRYDDSTLEIMEIISKEVDPSMPYIWRRSSSCYGPSAYVEAEPHFTYSKVEPLTNFRDALVELVDSVDCH